MENKIKPGTYQHFKGNKYEVLGIAKHSETLEELVVYKALYGDGGLWVRPLKMFLEKVKAQPSSDRPMRSTTGVNGEKVPRFKYIEK